MEMPEFTTTYEKLGVLGTMVTAVLWFLWHNIRHEYGKMATPDALSKRLDGIESEIGKQSGKLDVVERKVDRVWDKARDYEHWKERMIVMWDRHQERSFRRQYEQRMDDRLMDEDMRGGNRDEDSGR